METNYEFKIPQKDEYFEILSSDEQEYDWN